MQNILSIDTKVSNNTGFTSKQSFLDMYQLLHKKVLKQRYWMGASKVVSTKAPHNFKKTLNKSGPQHNVSPLDEFTLVMMKLRLDLNVAFLLNVFNISTTTCSAVFNTWVKFLARELRQLVFWPERKLVHEALSRLWQPDLYH